MLVATWNVNSISVRLEQVLDWMKRIEPDLLCLQETKTIDDKFPCKDFEQLGYHCAFFGEKTYNGVAIISKSNLSNVRKGFAAEAPSSAKRLIEATVNGLVVLNTYIPNGQALGSEKFLYKLSWLESLKRHIENYSSNQDVIWCGDFNIAPEDIDIYDPAAVAGEIMCSERERQMLAVIKEWGFSDALRLHEKNGGQYSWWDYRMGAFRRNMGFRIDHIWLSGKLANKCTHCWIDKEPRKAERPSDHAPVLAQIELD